MEASTIKFKTIQFIMGTKHISEEQIEDLGYLICHNLGIEKSQENRTIVREACEIYYELQMSLS